MIDLERGLKDDRVLPFDGKQWIFDDSLLFEGNGSG
jgi:hypothetical protein